MSKLQEAIDFATKAHGKQKRKYTGEPYISHPIAVMEMVREVPHTPEMLIAAVLHDYLEDIDGSTHAEVAGAFGERVADLVDSLSDAVSRPKPPWKERKDRYLAKLRTSDRDVKLIACADKLHNAQSIVRDHDALGEAVWDRFTASKEETLWYYRQVAAALQSGWSHPLLGRK